MSTITHLAPGAIRRTPYPKRTQRTGDCMTTDLMVTVEPCHPDDSRALRRVYSELGVLFVFMHGGHRYYLTGAAREAITAYRKQDFAVGDASMRQAPTEGNPS